MLRINKDSIRNIIFGVEDSLVSTIGVVFGIATATQDPKTTLTSGIIVVAVEAISMGAGSYLSEQSTDEYAGKKEHSDNPVMDGILMAISYGVSGVLVLLPYMLLPIDIAKYVSIGATTAALFLLGYIPNKSIKSAIRMAVVAGVAILAGFLIASLI